MTSAQSIAAGPRDLLLTNVRLVGNASAGLVDVALSDGFVAAIAGPGEIGSAGRASAGEPVDLDGRYLLRGLWDHHVHMNQWALARQRLDVSSSRSAIECAALIGQRLRETPPLPGEPLVAFGFRDGLWPHPATKEVLDSETGGVPVVVVSHDLHCGWLNSAALHAYASGLQSDGIVREGAFFALVPLFSQVREDVLDARVHDAVYDAARRGVVGVVELEMAPNLDTWARRVRAGTRGLRIECGVYVEHLDDALARGLRTHDVLPETLGLVTMGSLKVVTDGSLNTRTAYCYDPYPGLDGAGDSRGMLTVSPDELKPLMRHARAHAIDCAIHAIGDCANTLALDAFEETGARGTIEHAQLLDRADVKRFQVLGVAASVQPTHALDDRDIADRHWSGRTDRAFPYGDLVAAGATLRFGSDAPVAALDPWVTLAAAVHRSDDGRERWHPEQEVTIEAALDASTRGRFAVHEGDAADLVITELDPLVASPSQLREMAVHAAMVAGAWSFRDA